MIDWHRLFGLALYDFFTGSPYVVELEKDLSMKRQLPGSCFPGCPKRLQQPCVIIVVILRK
jgi:hypothetical protein